MGVSCCQRAVNALYVIRVEKETTSQIMSYGSGTDVGMMLETETEARELSILLAAFLRPPDSHLSTLNRKKSHTFSSFTSCVS